MSKWKHSDEQREELEEREKAARDMLAACQHRDMEKVRRLLEKDGSLAECSWGYIAPIHFAVRQNNKELVELLLQYGADATANGVIGWQDPPLKRAQDRGYDDIAALLTRHLESSYSITPEGGEVCTLIRQGQYEQALQLLDESPSRIREGDPRGNTPLHWAILVRQPKLIDELLRRGADIGAKRPDGATVLQLVIEGDYWFRAKRDLSPLTIRNEWFLVGYLVARGAEYDIWTAAAIGDTEQVAVFLKDDPSLASALNSIQHTPLHYAAKYGHLAAVKLLLDSGADPLAAEKSAPHGSALWHAASGGHNECAELLLERGADPNAMLDASGTALSIAMSRGNERLVRAMYTYGGSLRLDIACYLGKLELAGQLLGLDPSLANSEGDYGPLCMAAGFGHMDIVKLLLRCGADLNAPWYANNYMGYVMEDNLEMARFFLESGADPNLANWQGVTYLHKAAWKGDTAFAKLLLEFNVNLDAVDDEYRSTPLGWAAKYGQAAMVDWLLEHGADPLLPAREEWAQPLAWAKRRGHADIAARLETALAQ